jgi:hypothetical protein
VGSRHSFLRLQSIAFLKENKEVIQNGPGRLSSDIRCDRPWRAIAEFFAAFPHGQNAANQTSPARCL